MLNIKNIRQLLLGITGAFKMGHILKHNIKETGSIINSLDINQFNTDCRDYYIEQVEFADQGIFPMIHFVIRNDKINTVDHRCGILQKIPNTDKYEYKDNTIKMYDGIIWEFLKKADIIV